MPHHAAPAASATGHLAYTGTDSRLEVALAGVLLSVGALMVLLGRRRPRSRLNR
jgi:LPXTG-motif cell wall-anchored protein